MNHYIGKLACLGMLSLGLAACGHVPQAPVASAPVTVQDGTLKVGDSVVPYRDSGGAGTPVVFLHAASGKRSEERRVGKECPV